MSWLDNTDSEYKQDAPRWSYVDDHLQGLVLDPDRIESYLHKKPQGEADGAYSFRKVVADYTPHYLRAVVTLAGMLFAVEEDAQRSWGEEGEDGLGSPEEEGTIMHRLWDNADGEENNWNSVMARAAIQLVGKKKIYGLVEGIPRGADGEALGEATVKIVSPSAVPDKLGGAGNLQAVKLTSQADTRSSIKEEEDAQREWFVYQPEGYSVYRKDSKGEPMLNRSSLYGGEENPGFRYYATRRKRNAVLPIFSAEVDIEGHIGYLMAKKANSIFNLEATTDFNLITSAIHMWYADVQDKDGNLEKDLWQELQETIKEGGRAIPGAGHKFDGPPTSGAQIRLDRIEQKTKDFFTSFFQAYGDAAAQKTATQIRQDFRAGVEAYLTLLSRTLDEFENQLLWRLEQVYFPDNPEAWGGSRVRRSRDFSPVDIDERIRQLNERYLPDGKVPTGVGQLKQVIRENYEADGLEAEEGELEAIARAFIQTSGAQGLQRRLDRFAASEGDML